MGSVPAVAQQAPTDYASLTQRDQPGDNRLRCAQISIMIGQMNDLVANGGGSSTTSTSRGLGAAAGNAMKNTVTSKARGLFSSLGGGILGDLATGIAEARSVRREPQADESINLRQAAAGRRDRLLELASAKNCSGDNNITQAQAAARTSSVQASRDRPANFPQRNTYRGGIEDCTTPGSCRGTSDEVGDAPASGCRGGNLPGQFCGEGPLTQREKDLIRKGVTFQDAVKCNAAYTAAGLLKYRHDWNDADQAILDKIPNGVGGQNRDLWALIRDINPATKDASPEKKQVVFYPTRDRAIEDAISRYQTNMRSLLADYNYCMAKGATPTF